MKIAITSQDGKRDFVPPEDGPWHEFFSVIDRRGHSLVSLNNNPEVIIFMNNHSKTLRKIRKLHPKTDLILVIWEPRVTRPENFKEKDLAYFRKIFSPSSKWITGSNVVRFNWPQCSSLISELNRDEWQNRNILPAIFQANKFSFIKGEKYTDRRKVIKNFNKEIHVYGSDWNNQFRSWRNLIKGLTKSIRNFHSGLTFKQKPYFVNSLNYHGYVTNKDFELAKYRFALVIENSIDYVSEKIFEAIRNGCVVLYDGPNLEEFGIPNNIVISCPNMSKMNEDEFLKIVVNEDYCFEIAQTAVKFHNSRSFLPHFNENALRNLGNLICDSLQGKHDY